ncbi:lysophospholipase, putative [Plasmodium chabaudi chabaudi]|uniref:Lysophospholipase, putative n=2 Tax=Plasmodium chabaudi chabaudi TaxID=31271 RepID=A0A077TQ59_PLACU|nr:lysophospholipase, putative [Plasmodium chabaudi chabaudi]SCL91772.1 lysophospholipase, putative [Plasmodium chabaudi chabaudi]VTZ70658.1 lysophospholipase, putative [Plasmodium chabaudi chabaudi]|eukprot:XP_016654775.1 lysophospholipase, putative [Plasmodium chabaudi chabaudi]
MMEEIESNDDELRNTKSNLDGNPKIGWFCNKNGLLIRTYGWLVKNAIGIILLIHGFKAHARLIFMRINLKMPDSNEGLVVDTNNYYIYKDSWIEKFNQNSYSVYALDLQGHGESQSFENIRGNFNCFDDLVDDVMQYMNQIQDEISNDNQMNDEPHNIVTTKKKKLPMYVVGYSMGATIALRILQLLGEEKEDNINAGDENNYKKCKSILDNSTDVNELGNDMNNYNDYGSDNSCASGNHEGRYNYLDKLNIKGCVSISGMMRMKTPLNTGNKTHKYLYLPIINFLSRVAPHILIPPITGYKKSEYIINVCKHDKFINDNGTKFKCFAELIKAMLTLDSNINYIPKDIPILFVHSKDDSICHYKGSVSFYNKVNASGNELYPVDGMNHSTLTQPGNEEILKKVIDWISNLRTNDEDE